MSRKELIELLKADTAAAKTILKGMDIPEDKIDEVMKSLEPLKAGADNLSDGVAELVIKGLEALKPTEPKTEPGTVILKAEELEELRKSAKRAEEAEKIIKEERDKRILREFIAKAEKEFPALPETKPEDLGALLKAMSEKLSAEEFASVEKILKAADAIIQQSEVFKEYGRPGEGAAGSAKAELEAIAKGLIEKDANLTFEQAMVKACQMNPELANKYSLESSRR